MPAAVVHQNKYARILVVGCLSALAVPALAGDWSSSYFNTDRSIAPSFLGAGTLDRELRIAFSTDRDLGTVVLGGSYRRGQSPLSSVGSQGFPGLRANGEAVTLRAGCDFGDSLGYVSFGQHQLRGRTADAAGETLGIGLRISLNRALQLTGEFLHHSGGARAGTAPRQSPNQISLGAAFLF
ncbi:hypothetical protein [Pseudophaeobacter sp.]|uniref:hypothetical protein n=1 Tax=Pseudophaeobacter sp. TaxID=1971739 RepID=UPI00329943E1